MDNHYYAYKNATLLSIASGSLIFGLFGLFPGLCFAIVHFLGNVRSIKRRETDTIQAVDVSTEELVSLDEIGDKTDSKEASVKNSVFKLF